jgi:hypothetical protein
MTRTTQGEYGLSRKSARVSPAPEPKTQPDKDKTDYAGPRGPANPPKPKRPDTPDTGR